MKPTLVSLTKSYHVLAGFDKIVGLLMRALTERKVAVLSGLSLA